MKTALFLAPLLLITLTNTAVAFKEAKPAERVKKTQSYKPKLGTSFKFDGSALRGKYQTSLNTKATVENDKLLDDLLGGRTDFDDRAQQDQKRN